MSFFEQVIQRVFPAAKAEGKNNIGTPAPIRIQEKLTYSPKFIAAYQEWLQQTESMLWLQYLKDAINIRLNGIEGPSHIQCFSMDATRGFAILNEEADHDERLPYLLYHIQLQLKELGYIPQKSGRSIEDQGSFVQTKEGFYMKPNVYLSTNEETGKLNQLFGNITLELVYADKRASFIKVITTWYVDHNFNEAQPYEELLEKLFVLN
jgi:hypothetical protein